MLTQVARISAVAQGNRHRLRRRSNDVCATFTSPEPKQPKVGYERFVLLLVVFAIEFHFYFNPTIHKSFQQHRATRIGSIIVAAIVS
jgi:hypothetical protein